jgi:hypothetical protein
MWSLRVSVLTMPPELRDRYVRGEAWRKLRKKVWHLFRDEFGAAWACITTHPVGDENPTVFHPHLNVLWMRRTPGPGMMPAEELERLRARWGDVVGAERPTDVHGSFVQSHDRKRLRHRARYYARVFVGWGRSSQWVPKAVQWYGDFVRGTVPICKCPTCEGTFELLSMGDDAVSLYRALQARERAATGPPKGSRP